MDDPVLEALKWVLPGILVPMGIKVIQELKEIQVLLARFVEKTSSLERRVGEHDDEIREIRGRHYESKS